MNHARREHLLLEMYVSQHCWNCEEALLIAEQARQIPGITVQVIDLDQPGYEPSPRIALPPASHAILWGDWSRGPSRREWMTLLCTQAVTITDLPAAPFAETAQRRPLTRRQRAHWRQSPGRAIGT